jgi:branched-chain amino acid transport system permease protein
MASGLSLVFGLMDVLNFGHSAFISFGAFIAASVLAALAGWAQGSSGAFNLLAIVLAIGAATAFCAAAGWFFERIIVRPVYGDHLRQILITVGALIVAEQLILAIWGGAPISVPRPAILRGSLVFGDVAIEAYRIFAFLLGLAVFVILSLVLNRTRIGLLVRAGVENREMVEALGFRIDRLFVAVFVVGSALAGMGGAMWAGYQGLISGALGSEMLILVFIVVIIGGLGSIEGSLLGAILVGLMGNYVAFLMPKLSLASNMLLMMAVLLWRPYGLLPAVKR